MGEFREELIALINRHSLENGSDTPDWILAGYIVSCLQAFDTTTKARTAWYEYDPESETVPDPAESGGGGAVDEAVPDGQERDL